MFGNSWQPGEVPGDWKKRNSVPSVKKGRKEAPGGCQPLGLTSVPGKMVEEVLQEAMLRHKEGRFNWMLMEKLIGHLCMKYLDAHAYTNWEFINTFVQKMRYCPAF